MQFHVSTTKDKEIIDITDQVQELVTRSEVQDGVCHVFVRHATAAIIVNENADPNICVDVIKALEKAIPTRNDYLHDLVDGNAAAHIKASILGPSESVPIQNGKLALGTWQSIMMVELDGPRPQREIQIVCVAARD